MIHHEISQAVEEVIHSILASKGLQRPENLKITVEHPANPEHGDYSVNVAMQLARTLKKPPIAIAQEIQGQLRQHEKIQAWMSNIEVAPPGFINLYMDWSKWAAALAQQSGATVPPSQSKIIIEHTSINPNKSAHIGHLRNSCIGDTLARMLKRAGHQVEVHNYIDDLGNQLADTVVGILHTSTEGAYERFGDFCWETYAKINKAYRENPELQQERAVVLHALEQGNNNTAWMGLLVAERIVREHVEEMKQFRIDYDVLVWESRIVAEGFWERAFALLTNTPIFYKETEGKLAGCWVLKQPQGEEAAEAEADYQADKVLVRSNGILTYTAKDIAYHLWKFGVLGQDFRYKKFADGLWSTHANGVKKNIGHADAVINVIDHRQEYPQAMVKQALMALGFEEQARQLRHVSYGVVSLSPDTAAGLGVDTSDGRHSYPMSGRQGIGVKVADFLQQMGQVIDSKRSRKAGISSQAIAAAAVRYYLLRFNLQTEVIFDVEQASEVTGNTGVYLLYSYARSCSILEKAAYDTSAQPPAEGFDALEKPEYMLMRQLAYWTETLDTAIQELAPNQICAYIHELATRFNHFYATCPIMKAEESKRQLRLWLTYQFHLTMKEALDMLGLPAPKRM